MRNLNLNLNCTIFKNDHANDSILDLVNAKLHCDV